jgi:gliding motility-associated-like protein
MKYMKILFTLPLITLTINSLAQIPTNGLIGYWPFNGNANDESGNGNNGIVHGATLTEDRCGNENSAYYFDGNRQYIISNDTINISVAMPRTISVWLKWLVNDYSPEPGEHDILGWGGKCNVGDFNWLNMSYHYQEPLPYGHLEFNGHYMDLHTMNPTYKNIWAHLVCWYDGKAMKFFMNGEEDHTVYVDPGDPNNFSLTTVPTILQIGYKIPVPCLNPTDNGGWNTAFKGCIDDIRIYNRALSSEEILSLFSENVGHNVPLEAGTISGDKEVCVGQNGVTYIVTTVTHASNYIWNYSGTGATFTGNSDSVIVDFADNATSGDLTVAGINFCGSGPQSAIFPIHIETLPLAPGNIIGDTEVCKNRIGITYTLPIIENATSYVWNYGGRWATIYGSSNSIHIYFADNATSGYLTVNGKNSCGIGAISEEFPITVNSCDSITNILNIPNSFSPNGDGINDLFIIRGLTANAKLMIFNRSGKKLYESVNYQNDWNGKDNDGNVLESDTYWYVIVLSGVASEFKGFVYLKK